MKKYIPFVLFLFLPYFAFGSSTMEQYIHYDQSIENKVGYLYIGKDRGIDQSTFLYVKFALEDFKERGVKFIILHLNTPGGEVLSSLKIVDLLQKVDTNDHIPVIAFIDNWAISAGAMLAYSCRFIGIVPNAIMGAAEPVTAGSDGEMKTASEKVTSALRAEMSNLASFYGRDPLIGEAMVDKDIILVLRDQKIVKLSSESEIRKESDTLISAPHKLLTLNAKELVDFGVADFTVPSESNSPMALFKEPFLAKIPHVDLISYSNWKIDFFSILSHPAVASLLVFGLLIGFYIESNTPGFGIAGSIALVCLALIILSSFAMEAIHWIEVIILCAGLILLAIELFVIPGFGIIGIFGILLTIIGLFALLLPGIDRINFFELDSFSFAIPELVRRFAWLTSALIISIVAIYLMARFLSHQFFRSSPLVLRGEQEADLGYVAGLSKEMMPSIGEKGVAVTPLRPSGKVRIGEKLFHVVAQTGYIKANSLIVVIHIKGSLIMVKQC